MKKNNEYIEERPEGYKVHIPYTDDQGNRKFISKAFSVKKYGSKLKALSFAKEYRDEMKTKIRNSVTAI